MSGVDIEVKRITIFKIDNMYLCSKWKVRFFWQILLFLGETLNFTFKLVETESFGIWNTTSKSWNGLMESLVNNQSDFAITELAILKKRSGKII